MRMFQEAYTAAKLAFSSFKLRVRSNLAATHFGPETLEEAVQDYINRNVDLGDIPALIAVSTTSYHYNVRGNFLQGTHKIYTPLRWPAGWGHLYSDLDFMLHQCLKR